MSTIPQEDIEQAVLSVRVPKDLHTELKVAAAKENTTVQAILTEAVRKYVKKVGVAKLT